MAAPTVVNVGAQAFGTGGVTPGIPASTTTDDLLLLFCETAAETVTNPDTNVWTAAPSSPSDRGGGTRTTVFYAWQTSGGGISAPSIADPGDHIVCVIIAFRGVDKTNPFHQSGATSSVGTSNSVSHSNLTTTAADCLIVGGNCTSRDQTSTTFHGTPSNANLSGLVQQYQQGRADGNGGSLQIWTGTKAAAGSIGVTTVSLGNNNEVWTAITFALLPTQAKSGTGSLSTSATLTASGTKAASGTGSLTDTPTLTGTRIKGGQGSGTISATPSQTASGKKGGSASGSVTLSVTMSASGVAASTPQNLGSSRAAARRAALARRAEPELPIDEADETFTMFL